MSKHTPGPWKVDDSQVDRIRIVGADDSTVADCCDGFWNEEEFVRASESEPNARLIAAGPELLAASSGAGL